MFSRACCRAPLHFTAGALRYTTLLPAEGDTAALQKHSPWQNRKNTQMAACLFSNAHLAILEKPAGVHMTDKFAVSTAGRAVWTLDRSVGGLLLYAKTEHVAALAAGARLTYHALVTGEPRHLPGCTVLSCSSAVMARRISLVQLSTAASVSLPSVLRALSSNGHAVVGTSAMKAPGGCHIALTGVHLPAALGSLAFQLPVPRKLAKTQRREELHVLRREATTPSDSIIDFCGLSLLVRAGQLQPRRSSACLVDAAVERLATRPGARLLDLGCGVGSLLLATLSRLESPLGVAVGLDNDEEALSNAATNAAANALAGVHWVNGDFTALHVHAALRKLGPFDVILCKCVAAIFCLSLFLFQRERERVSEILPCLR